MILMMGLRKKYFTIEEMGSPHLINLVLEEIKQDASRVEPEKLGWEVARRLIGVLIDNVIATTKHNLEKHQPESVDDIRQAEKAMVAFSPECKEMLQEVKEFFIPTYLQQQKSCSRIFRHTE